MATPEQIVPFSTSSPTARFFRRDICYDVYIAFMNTNVRPKPERSMLLEMRRNAACAMLATALACAGAGAGATALHIATESAPPSSILQDGKVVGHATEKIRTIMVRAGVDIDITMLPWQRAYALALHQR